MAEVVDGKEGAVLAFAAGLFGLAAALVFVAAEALLFAALLFGVAAGLFLLAALQGGLLLELGVARGARVLARRAGLAGLARGAHAVAGEGLAGEGAVFLRGGWWRGRFGLGSGGGSSFLAAG